MSFMNTISVSPPLEGQSYSKVVKTFQEYLFAFFLSVICSLSILRIGDSASLYLPFDYFGDTIFYAMTIKSVITTGWYLSDPTLGMPGTHLLADFPTPESFNYLLIKLISLFTSHWPLVLNVFFLLGFPLITFSALFVFRSFGICFPLALTASLLYCFLPYHLIKEESHLFLSGYYIPPLAIWLAVKLYTFSDESEKKRNLFLYCLIPVLMGSNGVYYAYFGAFFILLGGCMGSFATKQRRPLKYACVFIVMIVVSIAINILPTFVELGKKGINHSAVERLASDSETFGLKITQLLLPRDDDRLLSTFKDNYNHSSLSVNENTTATLGIIGSLGFLGLIAHVLFKRNTSNLLIDAMSRFNISGVLLATMGGFSSLIALFILPGIRNYNRISVFIAFFSLAAFFLFLQEKIKDRKLLWGCSILLLSIGLFNQSSPVDAPHIKFPKVREEYENDRDFVERIEQILPPGSKVFQLPYMCFPEGSRDRINSYAHFKCPLHSHTLRWSFGAMKGRRADAWQKATSSLPVPSMVSNLIKRGFTGLYVDKFGYEENDVIALETALAEILKKPPIYDNHGRSFWDLR